MRPHDLGGIERLVIFYFAMEMFKWFDPDELEWFQEFGKIAAVQTGWIQVSDLWKCQLAGQSSSVSEP